MKKSRTLKADLIFPNRKPGSEEARRLDALDRRILRALQQDGLVANQLLAEEVGLSPPACLKRVRRLREAGVIKRTPAILSPEAMGYPLLTVVRLKLDAPADEIMQAFEAQMAASPRVMQCLLVAGDIDYILLVRSRDVAHYQEFARRMLRSAPGVRSYASDIVLTVTKDTMELPIDGL